MIGRPMQVEEVMSRDVLSVGPDTSLKDAAATLVERRISGLPVCDDTGRVLGVLSEADLLRKEGGPTHLVGGLFGWLVEVPDHDDVVKARARTVGEAMTAPALTIGPRDAVADAAARMIERRINRLPVVEDGVLVGIVTRADLVEAFARSDAEIEREIREHVIGRMTFIRSDRVHVEVSGGEVVLQGELESQYGAELLARLVARVIGVVAVHSELTWQYDMKGNPAKKRG